MCPVVTCWERADLLALVCGVQLWVCHFPIGILGQVWYFIVSIPNFAHLLTFYKHANGYEYQKGSEYSSEYHNNTLQTNPRHREEEPQNINSHKTSGRETNQLAE